MLAAQSVSSLGSVDQSADIGNIGAGAVVHRLLHRHCGYGRAPVGMRVRLGEYHSGQAQLGPGDIQTDWRQSTFGGGGALLYGWIGPNSADVLRFQHQVGEQRLVFGVRLVLDSVPLFALLFVHMRSVLRRTGELDIVGHHDRAGM